MIDALIDATGPLAYLLVMLAAIVEGEIVFAVAATLVSQGRLNPIGVIVAGALGGTIGDQFYFYALRGRLNRWIARWPAAARRGESLVRRVRQHEALTIISIRFMPGLRVALSAACAYAGVPSVKFSALNAISSLAWAWALLALIAWAGPAWLPKLGIVGWWAAIVPAIAVVIIAQMLAHALERNFRNRRRRSAK